MSEYRRTEDNTVLFTQEDIKAYLDESIEYWRGEREKGDYKADFYIDAFQSVRISLFGSLLE